MWNGEKIEKSKKNREEWIIVISIIWLPRYLQQLTEQPLVPFGIEVDFWVTIQMPFKFPKPRIRPWN